MDHKNAAALLEETFDNEFNIECYANFIKELFNHIKISIRDVPLRKEYYSYVETVNSLGVYRDSDKHSIEVFAIKLKRTSSRDRARTMQRNLIARYLSQFNRDAALVAFYGDEPEDWRFSFVKMEYELTRDEKGNLKVTEELTPARRHSFLVGKNESNHTCKIQFLGLIKEEDRDPQLVEIEEKFSIENVTKEFFTAYKKLFLDLKESLEEVINDDILIKEEFKDKNIKTTDFAKKLLGQIVFIYFLQKKGWLGVKKQESWGEGPKNFLRKLFNKEMANYGNFFNEMLEPLFYEALATERDGDYYSRFNCRIPFLNGGLFEPINDYDWIETDITLKNEIFEEILETFDLFNFTVKEDEPLEKEVAVDPEMLGKVFENLLEITARKSKGAFYTPREIVHYMCQQSLVNYLETHIPNCSKEDIEKFIVKGDLALDSIIREQEQKKTYHGRVFQKQVLPESIKGNSKVIDKLLAGIKVVDPAVGSGAFPVGMMNEIVRARHIISLLSEKEVRNYDLKRETIENSLYGVDIDSSAVDITKLRFWLSLVVDEEDIQNIKPLPNLDHKIMCGNSLIEEFEGMRLLDENLLEMPKINPEIEMITAQKDHLTTELKQLRDESPKNIDKITEIDNQLTKLHKKIKKIKLKTDNKSQASLFASAAAKKLKILDKKQDQFFNAESPNKKKKLRKEIESIEWEFIEETLKGEGNEESIDKLEEYKKNKSKPFFIWKLYFAEIFRRTNPGFDIVIANPPYVGEKGNKDIFRDIKQTEFGKLFYKRKMDYFYFFFHKAIDLCRNKGVIAFITTNYYITADGAIFLRNDFKNRTDIRALINFNELRIFDSAKGQHNMITFLEKGINPDLITEISLTSRKGDATPEILNSILSGNDKKTLYAERTKKDLFDGDKNYIRLNGKSGKIGEDIENILQKIKNNSELLGNIKNVNQGVLTGADKVTQRHLNKYGIKGLNKGDGIYVLSSSEIDELDLTNEEKILVKPFFKNSDIDKYFTKQKTRKNLIYATRDINIEKFPKVKDHFQKYKTIIQGRSKDRGEMQAALKVGKWWVIFAARKNVNFEDEKIVCPQRSPTNTFGYNTIPWYGSADVYFITNKKSVDISLKYILALLNSKLFYIWLYFRGKRKGELLELFYQPLTEIPIKIIAKDEQQPFIDLIDEILNLRSPNNKEELDLLKTKIDGLIYDLYDLNSAEREIVNNFKSD